MFFHFEVDEEQESYTKWALVFGFRDQTITAIAACKKGEDREHGTALKASVLSIRPATGAASLVGDGPSQAALQEEYVAIPSAGVAMRPPASFVRSESFDGFNHPSDAVSIMVVQLTGPFSEMDRGFTAENLAKRGLRLIDREQRNVNGQTGFFVHFAQSQAGNDYLKWSLIYGSEEQTTLITATCPKELQSKYAASLKSSILNVRSAMAAAPSGDESLSFEITPTEPFKFGNKVANTAMYPVDGAKLLTSPSEPIFVVAPALSSTLILDRRAYADARLKSNPHARSVTPESTGPITIDALEGFESLAKAEDAKTGTPIAVYQVILFTDDSYIVMQGLVGAEQSDKFVPAFQTMARSFKRKMPE